MTDHAVEALDPADARGFYDAAERGFGEEAREEDVAFWEGLTDPERRFVIRDAGQIVATSAAEPFQLTVPGGAVPMAGVTAVTVSPTHRRLGMLRAMMRRLLDDAAERGEPVAGLWASESSIYGRFGFGRAASGHWLSIDARRVQLSPGADVELRFRSAADALTEVPPIYDAFRPRVPGMLDVSTARWQWLGMDPEHWRDGAGPRQVVVAGDDRGYVAYRVKPSWEDGLPDGTAVVDQLVAHDLDAWRALWRFVLSIDLVSTVRAADRPVGEPLDLLLDDPRRARTRVADTLYVRLLDVPAALGARDADADGEVVVEVHDEAGYAGGRFRVIASGGAIACEPTSAGAALGVDVRELGRVYLGGVSVRRLQRAGLVDELRPGAAATLDRMLHSPVAPWCPFEF